MCRLNLQEQPLTQEEYVPLLRDRMAETAQTELESAFETRETPLTWEDVTVDQLKTILVEQFGDKEPDISSVLKCFGPDRFKKTKDMSASKHYHMWKSKLPKCLLPTTTEGFKKANDLVLRCIYYQSLDDQYLKEKLCNLKSDNLCLKQFYDEVVISETKRKNFEETTVKSNILDPSTAVSINKTEYSPSGHQPKVGGNGRPTTRRRGGRGRGSRGGAAAAAAGEGTTPPPHPPTHSGGRGRGAKLKRTPTC